MLYGIIWHDLPNAHYLYLGSLADSKVYGANMGPTWGRQDQGGPNIGQMNFAICGPFY